MWRGSSNPRTLAPSHPFVIGRDARSLRARTPALLVTRYTPSLMCGLTGFVTASRSGDLVRDVRRMCDAIAHRGPDDSGEWIDAEHGVALGFRRLSIIDLSPAGHQPMASARCVATLNGEIYNFEELRRELPPRDYRGHSDTEVMLAAFEAWGVEKAATRFNGMFAIAVWDRQTRRLH